MHWYCNSSLPLILLRGAGAIALVAAGWMFAGQIHWVSLAVGSLVALLLTLVNLTASARSRQSKQPPSTLA